MKNHRALTVCLSVVVFMIAMLFCSQVQAEVQSYSLGIGVGAAPDYEGSQNYEAVPIPFARVVWDNGWDLTLQGPNLKLNLLPHEVFSLGPVAHYRPGRDDVENDKVDRLEDVDDAFELGVFAGFDKDNWNALIEVRQDVADGHDGLLVELGGGYRWPVQEGMSVSIGAETTYASGDYMNSYFSIDSTNSARSGLKTFNADEGFKDVGFTLGISYMINENWRVQGIGNYTLLLDDAADSPVVDDEGDENQYFGGILFIYTFGKAKAKPVEIEPYNF
ncbi:MipA/OmpV family protein [bacterium]|nr:MAG: MipA/OmpV family protein [bacterium]